jgi:ribosomal protein L15
LGKLSEWIEKGFISVKEPITIKTMYDSGVVTKVGPGLKLLGRGAERFKELGVPIHLECSDASQVVIDTIKEMGGSISVKYRTNLTMRNYLKPHKR